MATTAAGSITLYLANLETLLANSATFQTWTGAADATAALAFIHLYERSAGKTRPNAFLYYTDWSDADPLVLLGQETVSMAMRFEASSSGDDVEDEVREFLTKVGTIKDEMKVLSGTDDYIYIQEWSLDVESIGRNPQEEQTSGDAAENYIQCVLEVSV